MPLYNPTSTTTSVSQTPEDLSGAGLTADYTVEFGYQVLMSAPINTDADIFVDGTLIEMG